MKVPNYQIDENANNLRWQLFAVAVLFGLLGWWWADINYVESALWAFFNMIGCLYLAFVRIRVRKYLKAGVYENSPTIR